MAGIFISYRRADSDGWAGRLRDALRVRFGELVFQDVDNIPDGEIFSDVIDRALQECDVALIIIGPNWASAQDESGRRRLDQEDDWVRTETAMVLSRRIRVIPVLVGGARLPRAEELPEELRSLTRRQAREIRSTSWDSDVALLTHHLKQIVRPGRKRSVGRPALTTLAVLLGIAVVAGGVYVWRPTLTPAPDQRAAAPVAGEPPSKPAAIARPARETPGEPAKDTSREPPAAIASQPADAPRPVPVKPAESAKPLIAKSETPKPGRAPPAPAEPQKSETVASGKASEQKSERVAAAKPPAQRTEPVAAVRPPAQKTEPVAAAKPPAQKTETVAAAKPATRAAAPEREPARTERGEVARAVTESAPSPAEPRKPASAPDETSAERTAAAATAQKPPAAPAAPRAVTLNLPNRPASARELKIGDTWTYRLREARFDRDLATVRHEIGGGDPAGIRETVRLVTKKGASDPDADAAAGLTRAQRRLPLEPRIFEQQLSQGAMLFEFAPFMTAFSDLQPGVRWARIAGASSSDSISDWRFSGIVTGRERVRVPAGTFEAMKAELEGQLDISFPSTRDPFSEMAASYQKYSIWFVPEIGRAVKYERRTFNRGGRLLEHEQYELLSYQLK